ncbi:MAG: adenine deaminase [Saprospiraceae bacterium]|nr:adenine deaminase [Saprospiraceae bacterium]
MTISGNIVDIFERKTYFGELTIDPENKVSLKYLSEEQPAYPYLLPGFIDAHVHIESSMLTPAHFARLAVVHGTIGTVSDPHEIGNVLGTTGVKYMIAEGKNVNFHFCFGAPSCVPATGFENAGAVIDSAEISSLLCDDDIYYLAEMMNYPGVLWGDEEVSRKINSAIAAGKPIDGHAPGMTGNDAVTYFGSGITTDHECFTYEEAYEKLQLGVKILIREGSAAKNFEALIPLARAYSHLMMFCSDDKHPDNLVEGHINQLVVRAIREHQLDLYNVLKMACVNPVLHYGLKSGLMRNGDNADFIMVKDLHDFTVIATYINGHEVSSNGVSKIPMPESKIINHFNALPVSSDALRIKAPSGHFKLKAIEVLDGQLVTRQKELDARITEGYCESNVSNDALKIVVYNRYKMANPAVAFIHGFGLKCGAIASSVAHDSHNILAVGVNDEDLANAINLVVKHQGGVVACHDDMVHILPLPVAGLMSHLDGYEVAARYKEIDAFVKNEMGCVLASPFMSLSFMALLVIPSLKLSDLGLFDGSKFEFTDMFV